MKTKAHFELLSYGLKTGKELPKADMYIDCRGLADGSKGGPGGTGDSKAMQDYVMQQSPASIISMHRLIEDSLKRIPSRRDGDKDPYERPYRVCFMCAHGIHRSRSAKNLIAGLLTKAGYEVKVIPGFNVEVTE